MIIDRPTYKTLLEAKGRFASLLRQSRVPEVAWQKLFSDCPYVLSEALPLSISANDIQPLGRPGKSEPDLIFYPHKPCKQPLYGVIELKTADQRILTNPRKNIFTLSRAASTAVEQARSSLKILDRKAVVELSKEALFLGNSRYAFIIMGLSDELTAKLASDIHRQQLNDQLPPNFQLLPYDTLFSMYESRLPAQFILVGPNQKLMAKFDDNDESKTFKGQQIPDMIEFQATTRRGLKIEVRQIIDWLIKERIVTNLYVETMDDASWDMENIVTGPRWSGINDLAKKVDEYAKSTGLGSRSVRIGKW